MAHPALDAFFVHIANFGLLKWPVLIAGAALLLFGRFREKSLVILLGASVLFGDAVVNSTLKTLANRPRPYQSVEGLRHVRLDGFRIVVEPSQPGPVPRGRSFPSNHASNCAIIAMVFTLVYPPWGALAWSLPLLMAVSRVYTGDHFPSDVLAGILIGAISTLLICCVASRIWQSWGPTFMPLASKKYPSLLPRARRTD